MATDYSSVSEPTVHLTDKDDIAANGFGMFGHNWGHSTTNYHSNVPGNWLSNLDYSHNRGDHRGAHAELSYTHKWRDNHVLDITGSFNNWSGPNNRSYLQDITYADREETIYQEQNMDMSNRSWEVKVDYTNQFNEYLKARGWL